MLVDDHDRRSDSDGWFCYSAAPGIRYDFRTGERIATRNRVLLVFVNKEMVAYNWRWEEQDPHRPGAPVGWEDRFVKEALG